MPVWITTDAVVIEGTVVSLSTFGSLVERHLRRYQRSKELEGEAVQLYSSDFDESLLEQFIRRVCTWGGYSGIAGRVINHNPLSKIRIQFRSAFNRLESDIPDTQGAMNEINRIQGLGTPSFASKHLRFLRPQFCPVLDSILHQRLHYRFDPVGYKQLSDDCIKIGTMLQQHQIANPMNRNNGQWFAADVEMAVFAHINRLWQVESRYF